MAQAWKLSSGKVVAVEGGVTQVLTPPVGVHYDLPRRRWVAMIADGKTDWIKQYFPISNGGIVKALELATATRELSLKMILNYRLLPRIRRGYTVRKVGDLYAVYDPLDKRRHFFTKEAQARAYNDIATNAWIVDKTYDKKTMVEIRTQLDLNFTSVGDGEVKPLGAIA